MMKAHGMNAVFPLETCPKFIGIAVQRQNNKVEDAFGVNTKEMWND